MRLRGSEADHTLVLIDGMRVTDANVTPFNLLGGESLFGLATIEVLRGPQSALYGSEAIGGVVSLETKVGEAGGPQLLGVEDGVDQRSRPFARIGRAAPALRIELRDHLTVVPRERLKALVDLLDAV